MPALLLVGSITLAALLVPYGKVLFDIWGWPITEGALRMGLSRGILLLGLLYLSRISVVQGLSLPGKAGQGVSRVFFYLDRFSEHCSEVSVRDLPASLDKLLHAVSKSDSEHGKTTSPKHTPHLPLFLPLAVSLLCWLLVFL